MQLVAYGAQDIYLTGNPQITFFKVVYRRHTNFSMEAIEQTLNGTAGFGSRVTATISRNGDLVHRMYYELDLTPGATDLTADWGANAMGHNLGYTALKEVELEIGGQKIDKQLSSWMTVWDELSNPEYKQVIFNGNAIGTNTSNSNIEDNLHYAPSAYQAMIGGWNHAAAARYKFTIPLSFWFCRNPGLALPLIALQYHEVKVITEFEAAANFNGVTCTTFHGAKLFADYIYLDTDERRRFAQVSHEYLIEQVQHQESAGGAANTTANIDLNFNHPVKELVWCSKAAATSPTAFQILHPTGLTATNTNQGTAQLKLNGHDRISTRDMQYFTRTQPYQHHTNVPLMGRIGVYSFALKPEEHQPSGTCNFSRIDNAQLSINCTPDVSSLNLHIFAVNYNVLRIMSGMGGLAYSN